jgi:hypothetical protein
VAASVTVTSATYAASSGPATTVTVPASTNVMVILTARITDADATTNGTGLGGYLSFVSTGGTGNVAADDTRALAFFPGRPGDGVQVSATFFVTGLSAGSHTFTTNVRNTAAGSGTTFANRSIVVIPMP